MAKDIGNPNALEERHAAIGRGFDTLDDWAMSFDPEKQRTRDMLTIEAMETFGGDEVKRLGAAARVAFRLASAEQMAQIKLELGFYWSRYEAEAGRRLLKKYTPVEEMIPCSVTD